MLVVMRRIEALDVLPQPLVHHVDLGRRERAIRLRPDRQAECLRGRGGRYFGLLAVFHFIKDTSHCQVTLRLTEKLLKPLTAASFPAQIYASGIGRSDCRPPDDVIVLEKI
jgi:hypothetical protein